jgi:hypothetical protein
MPQKFSDNIINELKALKIEIGSSQERVEVVEAINYLIERLISKKDSEPSKQLVLDEFQIIMNECDALDSEDQERIAVYLEKIMDIFNIASSDGLINTWLYGFDPFN